MDRWQYRTAALNGYRYLLKTEDLVRGGSAAFDRGDYDVPLVNVEVVENPVITHTLAPLGRLQAFNVSAEGIVLKRIERVFKTNLVLA